MNRSEPFSSSPQDIPSGWTQFVPGPENPPSDDSFQVRLRDEVTQRLQELRREQREGQLGLARTVSQVALDCARVLDGMEQRLQAEPDAGMQERLESLRARVYGKLAEALERSRKDAAERQGASLN